MSLFNKVGFNQSDLNRNACQLVKGQATKGYDWWWHSFTARNAKTNEEKAFFIEFFLCNPATGKDEPVFGQLQSNKRNKIKPSYLMVKVGCWGEDARQLHRFYGWNKINVVMKVPFEIDARDCFLSETYTKGSVDVSEVDARIHPEWMSDAGSMSWDLKIDKQVAFNVGFGADEHFRDKQYFEMFWHAEGMKTQYEGKIYYNGEEYIVSKENSYGYADKNWGKDFTSPWVWLSSNNLTSELTGEKLENSVFDIGGGRPKIKDIALNNKLLSAFWYEGKPYEFNFSKVWTKTETTFDCRETDSQIIWDIIQTNLKQKMVTHITCQKKDMLLINYEAPNGKKRHNRLWNGGNGKGRVELYEGDRLIDRIYAENVGCEYGEYD